MHPKYISIKDYSYLLPEDKIAKFPLPNRAEAKLLIYDQGKISESQYLKLAEKLRKGCCLVYNNTKVVEARLLFKNSTNATIEIFCLEPSPIYNDITNAMLTTKKVIWHCLVGKAKKWKEGEILKQNINHQNQKISLTATLQQKIEDYFIIEFSWEADISFAELLHVAGIIPLPPYLKREAIESDNKTYQTTYAKHDGSVAAPTAGLHFTPEIFASLQAKNISECYVTLHVGAGTFKPVKTETMNEHVMHSEFIDVSVDSILQLCSSYNNGIIAVGTTSLRTIESLYWMGVKCMCSPNFSLQNASTKDSITQWEVYDLPQHYSTKEALQALINCLQQQGMQKLITKTQIIIAPTYKLKVAKGLITNFHQPNSTLLLLVAAVVGEDWKKIYDYALANEFRFLSYGDGSLLMRNDDLK